MEDENMPRIISSKRPWWFAAIVVAATVALAPPSLAVDDANTGP
jgi:hypothetical protein